MPISRGIHNTETVPFQHSSPTLSPNFPSSFTKFPAFASIGSSSAVSGSNLTGTVSALLFERSTGGTESPFLRLVVDGRFPRLVDGRDVRADIRTSKSPIKPVMKYSVAFDKVSSSKGKEGEQRYRSQSRYPLITRKIEKLLTKVNSKLASAI